MRDSRTASVTAGGYSKSSLAGTTPSRYEDVGNAAGSLSLPSMKSGAVCTGTVKSPPPMRDASRSMCR